MSDILLVPIKLDALVLTQPTQVVAPLADFSSLPYVDPKSEGGPRDVNSDTAFLSSNVLSEPFEDDGLLLQAGVHLHWALPDALTIGRHPYKRNKDGQLIRNKDRQLIPDTDHVEHPVVPNRWLVLRRGGGLKAKSWVVESDYLWPEGEKWEEGRITYLIPPESRGPHKQPYRYLGRTQLVEEWHAPEKGGYLEELKVYGYGEPNFAAFYPSCQGVFGLHDEEVTAEHDGVSYRVLGWIGGPKASSKDILHSLSAQLKDEAQKDEALAAKLRDEALVAKLADEFKWTLPECYSKAELKPTGDAGTFVPTGSLFQDDGQSSWRSTVDATLPDTIQVQAVDIGAVATAGAISTIVTPIAGLISVTNPSAASPGLPVPQRIMCYAELKSVKAAGTRPPQNVKIAVGNTGTEALSAWLANELDAGDSSGKIENQLEALHLEDGLRELDLDLGPRFHEARHDASFHAVSGGTRWTLHARGKEPAESASAAKQPVDLAALPFEIATLLHELNDVRAAWDRAQADIVSARRQIFIEWHKYATCCHHPDFPQDDYPDIDELEAHIDRMIAMLKLRCFYAGLSSDPPGLHLEALSLDHLRQLTTPDESAFRSWFHAMKVGDVCPPPLAYLFADKKAALEAELAKLSDVEITLREAAAPRYWRPNDPVLLLAGEGVQTTDRHGEDGVLSCRVVSDGDLDLDALETSSDVNKVLGTVLDKAAKPEEDHTDGAPWASQIYEAPWHPLFIEWEVSLQPTRGGNVSSTGREYPAEFIEESFELTETRCEFRPKDGKTEDTAVGTSFMTGRSILVPHARLILERRIEDYLVLHLIELLREQAKPDDAKPPLNDEAKSLLEPGTPREELLDWLRENEPQVLKWSDAVHKPNKSPMHTVLDARKKLDDWENEGKAFQSQALGGLNEALLMRHDVLQLVPVAPQGFTESNDFVERVKEAVDMKHYTHHAPLPHFDFHPIRSGLLRLERLRLVDTFGRPVDLSDVPLVRAEQMEVPQRTEVALPPRFTQPARLNFRFLSANEDWLQTNSHPLTTPVCGWIASNNLDRSVMIYDGSGAMLGSIDWTGRWRTPPGRPGPILPNDIANDHLARMVTWLCTQARLSRQETQAPTEPSLSIDAFIDAIDSALENIDPEGFAQHQARALLMSRPLALVRAAVSLEVQGQPAFDQSWDAFGGVMRGGAYDTAGFLDVRVPIRIGEHLQLNDGVAAYWLDTDEGFAEDRLYLPQSEVPGQPLTSPLCLSDAPQLVSMLLDPRGTAHATCGLLPTKVLRIPPEHFSKALEAINVTFLSSPLLTPSGRMELTLPSEPGWHWSWVHREDGSWQEWTTTPVVERSAFRAAFSEKSREVWQQLLDQNWITEINYERARVNATKERNTPQGPNTPPVLTVPGIESEDIERVLDIATRVLQPAPLQARFNRTEIREGWLQLTRDPTQRSLP